MGKLIRNVITKQLVGSFYGKRFEKNTDTDLGAADIVDMGSYIGTEVLGL